MVKNVGATNENRRNRINCILKHIIKYKESQKKLTEKRLLLLLARDGHNITRAQLGKDKQSIREENTFVADLAKYSYSQIMEDEMNTFYSLRDRLRRLFDSKKAIETVFTMVNDEDKQKTIKIAKTPNELLVIKQMTDITFTINKIINGDILDVSIAHYIQNTRRLETEVQLKDDEIALLKEQLHAKSLKVVADDERENSWN